MKIPAHLTAFLRFVLVGVIATALHYGIYLVLQRFINATVAYTTGYVLSFVANFYLTAYFTFRSKPSWGKAAGFAGAHLCNYLLHIGLLNLFLWVGIPRVWAPLPVFAIAIPANFLMVKYAFSRRKRR